ncbi:ABC transporter permease [Desulfofustis glycolicus]|uniref:Putative ABC transport system permease protein n=1 Tax=Desulfofustis glycolicus DSM 9705 TaxID=1121409 RepID=A0A1M5XWW8_9BACT|nr:iron export ABC transporter permease subunit FetB [Desulfofustis glycolicus]MCB2215487.1 iron export ABC transporter permease subunit FetB [Desulfobulbaceae bacterium]SHI04317.1 putative ABC transport system permease protein [Desulfofustis glycolicus DSM 9705]
MNVATLSAVDLALSGGLILLLAVLSFFLNLGLGRRLLISAARMTVQLLLIGMVLQALFASKTPWFIMLISSVMLLAAGHEVRSRLKCKIKGLFGFGVGVGSMFVSSFSVTVLTLIVILQQDPWYDPRYAIPILGMLLGNTMNGVALAADRMTTMFYEQRELIEQRLMLGETWHQAISELRRDCMRTGMIPIINSMAAAGLVSLPGMMTGQILGGSPPVEAVKYQILIMLLIAAGAGFGVVSAILMIERHLFDHRHRLCLERLLPGDQS